MNEYFKAPAQRTLRRRIAPALLVVGLGSAFKLTFDAAPRPLHVQLTLPERLRPELRAVRLTYLDENEAVSGTEQRFQEPAPATFTSAPDLSPGDYLLLVELERQTGAVVSSRHHVRAPSRGTVRIQLQASP